LEFENIIISSLFFAYWPWPMLVPKVASFAFWFLIAQTQMGEGRGYWCGGSVNIRFSFVWKYYHMQVYI